MSGGGHGAAGDADRRGAQRTCAVCACGRTTAGLHHTARRSPNGIVRPGHCPRADGEGSTGNQFAVHTHCGPVDRCGAENLSAHEGYGWQSALAAGGGHAGGLMSTSVSHTSHSINYSYKNFASFLIDVSILGLITGCFGKNMVQQSSYGNIDVSYVTIFFAISIISNLSIQQTGLITGKFVTELIVSILVNV